MQVGTVAGVHGNDGWLRIRPESDNPARFSPGSVLHIAGRPHTVRRSTRASSGLLLVKLDGLDSREAASQLSHESVFVPLAEVPNPPADTYYHYQLLDMDVVTQEGEPLGKIGEVVATGANDVYVVRSERSELLVPAIADVVVAVDVGARRMTVVLLPGLEPRPLPAAKPAARRKPRGRRPRRASRPNPGQ